MLRATDISPSKSFLVISPNYRFSRPQNSSQSEPRTTDYVRLQIVHIENSELPIFNACKFFLTRSPDDWIVRLQFLNSQSSEIPTLCASWLLQFRAPNVPFCTTLNSSESENRTTDLVGLQIITSQNSERTIQYDTTFFVDRILNHRILRLQILPRHRSKRQISISTEPRTTESVCLQILPS
jgi:hypothetical protein